MTAPTLYTERLILRAPKLSDFEHWAAFFASPRADHERGRKDRAEAWRFWAADVALWQLKGYGPFSLDDRATGAYVGEVGLYDPEGYPEPEIGWFTTPEAEGKGYAFEAARAVLDWTRRTLGWDRLVSYIDAQNTRSLALAHRLGGVIDPTLAGTEPGDVVVCHDLRRLA